MFSAIVLFVAGVFAVIDGLVAVNKSTFFTQNAVYVFSDLRTWGWIVFGLGVAGIAAGLAVFSGREWARWTGIVVAGLGAVGQLLFAQAYPLWSLMIMGLNFLVIYGLAAYGGRDYAAGESYGYDESSESSTSPRTGTQATSPPGIVAPRNRSPSASPQAGRVVGRRVRLCRARRPRDARPITSIAGIGLRLKAAPRHQFLDQTEQG